MNSKKISLSNFGSPKNKNNERNHISKYMLQLKKNYSYNKVQDISKIQKILKKESEIQNNSIIEEDDYNEEIYNNPIASLKFTLNDESNYDHKSKSSFSSFEDKSKNIYFFNSNKYLTSNDKHDKYSMESLTDSNYTFQDSNFLGNNTNAKSIDKDNLFFMNIINAFDKNNKMKENNKKILLEKNEIKDNKISNKFSRMGKKKKFKQNIKDNSIEILTKSPSLQFNGNNKRKNYISKINITENKNDNKMPYTESKKILSLREEEINIEQNNNLQSIAKNLFNKNFELNDNKTDKKIKNSRFHIGLSKKIISDRSNGGINLQINNNNNNPMMNKLIPNSKMMNKFNNRKSKSMISEENLEEIYKINKKFAKRGNSPYHEQNIIIKKKIILDEDLINKEKMLSAKKPILNNKSIGNSILNINNIEKNIGNKDYNSLIFSSLNYTQEQKDIDNNKYIKYLYSNSRNKEKKENKINISEQNINNNNSHNKNNINNKRKYVLNNSLVSPVKEEIKNPNFNTSINKIKAINEERNNRLINYNNFPKVNLDQPQSNKNIKIKIEKPLFHSRQISEQNILHKSNSNRPSITKSVHNLNQIKNLKKQFANPQNSIKINIDNGGKRKQILINSRSCILKPDQLKKEYNYNEIIMNHNKNSINALKNTISQITLTRNDENTNTSKNEEVNKERSLITKRMITRRAEGDKISLDSNRFQNNYLPNRINQYKDPKNSINYNNENKNIISPDKKKYLKEENHQNKFERSHHKIHEIRSTSIDQSLHSTGINYDPFSSKIKCKLPMKVTSTSMDNIRVFRYNKNNGNTPNYNINRINFKQNGDESKNDFNKNNNYKRNILYYSQEINKN